MADTDLSDKEATLKFAMQTEKDGMEFYAEAAKNSSQALGRNLFLSLVEDERTHYEWLETLLEGAEATGAATPQEEAKARFETVFTEARDEAGGGVKGCDSDLEAIEKAKGLEQKGYAFYKKAAAESPNAAVRELCEKLAAWEKVHYQLLENTRHYLSDPRDWFTWEERPMLDDG
jgi:rubrerythrin